MMMIGLDYLEEWASVVLGHISIEKREGKMKERLICVVALTVFVMFVAAPSFAKGLLGNRYTNGMLGQTTPGDDDLREFDDSIIYGMLYFNFAVNQNLDANASWRGSSMEGDIEQTNFEVNTQTILGGIDYHFSPGSKMNPVVGVKVGYTFVEAKASASGYTEPSGFEEDDDFAFSVGGGIEVDISDKTAIRPTIVYNKFGDEDDVAAGLGLNIWFTKDSFARLTTSYAFDNGDFSYAAGLGFGF